MVESKEGVRMVKKFCSSKLILYIFLMPLVVCTITGILSLVLTFEQEGQATTIFLYCIIIYCIIIGFEMIFLHNAFYRVNINKVGISNKYLDIPWSNIKDYRIIELRIGIIPTFLKMDIICFSKRKIVENSFVGLNPREIVFISLTDETIDLIKTMSGIKMP